MEIQVIEVNNNTSIATTPLIRQELYDYMKIWVDGAQFSPKFKKKHWDGFKRLCSKRGKFPTGLLPMAIRFLEEEGYLIKLVDCRDQSLEIPENVVVDLYEDISLRDYQIPLAVDSIYNWVETRYGSMLYFPRGIVDAATNAGKNYSMLCYYLSFNKPKTVILIHNREIFRQLVEFFTRATGVEECGYFHAEKAGIKIGQVTVCMYKTLYARAKKGNADAIKVIKECVLLLTDETHRVGAKDYSALVAMFTNAYARYFVSGTPLDRGNKGSNFVVRGLSGDVLHVITNEQLVEWKVSLQPIIHMYENPVQFYDEYATLEESYFGNIVESVDRNRVINKYVKEHSEYKILIAVKRLEHGELLAKMLDTFFLSGGNALRDDIFDDFKSGHIKVLVTTLLREGVNIPDIDALILAQGGMSVIEIKQLIGRVIRDDNIHKTVDVIDFMDQGKYVNSHSMRRYALYRSEKFMIRLHVHKIE